MDVGEGGFNQLKGKRPKESLGHNREISRQAHALEEAQTFVLRLLSRDRDGGPVPFEGRCDLYRLVEYLTSFIPDPPQLFPLLEFGHQLVYLAMAFFWGVLLQLLSRQQAFELCPEL